MRIYGILCCIFAAATITSAAYAADYNYTKIIPDDVSAENDTRAATRADFCKILYKMLETKDAAPQKQTAEFSDTDDEIIGALCAAGLVEGAGDNLFLPDENITREEAAKLLCAAMDALGMKDRNVVDGTFSDIDAADEWARDYIEQVGRNEIMQGYGNGYYTWKDSEAVIHRPDVFRLEDSVFDPTANYTVRQSLVTIYRLCERIPDTENEKQSWDVEGGIRLCTDGTVLWSEKDGETALIEPAADALEIAANKIIDGKMTYVGYKDPDIVTLQNGDIVMASGCGVYSLVTGKRLLCLETSVDSLTPLYASCTVSFTPGGTSPEYVKCDYDFEGNRFALGSIDTITDSSGAAHYIYCSRADGGTNDYVFSKGDSLESLVVSGREIITDTASNDMFCTESSDSLYDVYNVYGDLLYKGAAYVKLLSNDMFAVKSQSDAKTLGLYRGTDKICDLAGSAIYDEGSTPKNFIITTTDSKTYNLCGTDGTSYRENAKLYVSKTDDGDIKITCYDGSSVSYYSDSTGEMTASIPAPNCSSYGDYFYGYSDDLSISGIYASDGTVLLDFSGMDCYRSKNYLYVYPKDGAENKSLYIYDAATLELIKTFEGEQAEQFYGGYVNFSDDPLRGDWYSAATDKRTVIEYAAEPKVYIRGGMLIIDVKSEGYHDVTVYNSDLEIINNFAEISSVSYDETNTSDYFIFGTSDGEKLYLPATNEVVLERKDIDEQRLKSIGLQLFTVYDEDAKQRAFYSLKDGVFEYMFTVAVNSGFFYGTSDYIAVNDNEDRVFYDYNGNLYSE